LGARLGLGTWMGLACCLEGLGSRLVGLGSGLVGLGSRLGGLGSGLGLEWRLGLGPRLGLGVALAALPMSVPTYATLRNRKPESVVSYCHTMRAPEYFSSSWPSSVGHRATWRPRLRLRRVSSYFTLNFGCYLAQKDGPR
jgi:hypothetical protein